MLLTLLIGGALIEAVLFLSGAGVAVDIPRGQLAQDGEHDREAEVAAEAPPHATLAQTGPATFGLERKTDISRAFAHEKKRISLSNLAKRLSSFTSSTDGNGSDAAHNPLLMLAGLRV